MKKLIKALIVCLAVSVLCCAFASCGAGKSGTVTNVKLTVKAGDTIILNDVDVAVTGDDPTVMSAFRQAMDDDDGFPEVRFDNDEDPTTVLDIGEFHDSTEKYWEFRVNDKSFSDIKGRANAYSVKEGDRIYFEYGASSTADAED